MHHFAVSAEGVDRPVLCRSSPRKLSVALGKPAPCLLASALTLAASEGGVWQGGILLGVFGVGAATPLVAVAYASRRGFQSSQVWVLRFADRLKKTFGLWIALTGLAILTGADKWLEAWVLSVLPDVWLRLTTLI